MDVLPDFLATGLRVVFCGTAVAERSAEVRGYYAGRGNDFWGTLFEVELIPEPLGPHLSHRVLDFGIGLTDLAKSVAASSNRHLSAEYDVAGFVAKMEHFRPKWVAFHGIDAARPVGRMAAEHRDIVLGEQDWQIGASRVFVCPSMSASNRNPRNWGGRTSREDWFRELARLVRRT
jgi:TDG/mug DNA glycosylase family protein